MKALYISSTPFYKEHRDLFDTTKKTIEKYTGTDVRTYTDKQAEDFNFEEDHSKIVKLVKDSENEIKNADILIADITISSAGTGYDIASALNQKKPVLVLKQKNSSAKRGPHTITVKKTRLLNHVEYSNKEDLDKVIKDFVSKAKTLLDTKFILIISAEIDRYLEWASDNKRMHKAQLVRNAVEEMMGRDRDWKKSQDA